MKLVLRWTVPFKDVSLPVVCDESGGQVLVVLAPGAGSHSEHKTLLWLAGLLNSVGARVARFDFPYRVQGKVMPDRMPVLMQAYRAVIESVRSEFSPSKLLIGGHSMGGRVASMVESEGQSADGLLLFGYPLHPPGQPEKLRDGHLPSIVTPTLQVNGTNDEFCTPSLMEAALPRLQNWQMVWVEGADHSYSVKSSSGRTKGDAERDITTALTGYLDKVHRDASR